VKWLKLTLCFLAAQLVKRDYGYGSYDSASSIDASSSYATESAAALLTDVATTEITMETASEFTTMTQSSYVPENTMGAEMKKGDRWAKHGSGSMKNKEFKSCVQTCKATFRKFVITFPCS
jgi:hypothetical protein